MILVLLGTQNNSFVRLLKAIQENIDKKVITDEVVVQAGFTKFDSKDMKIFGLIDKKKLSKLQDKADLIITHGVVVPRLKKYNEHVNDHQIQIAEKFEKNGYVRSVTDLDKLGDTIKSMKDFEPKKYISGNEKILSIIEDYINNN